MSLPKYKDLEKLSEVNEIEKEIFLLTKELLNLRIKKATNQTDYLGNRFNFSFEIEFLTMINYNCVLI